MKNKDSGHMTFESMPDKIFIKFSSFIQNELGIKMPDAKRTMLQARLQKRLRKLGIESFKEYSDFVFSKRGMDEELHNMIDAVTTNKTDFFREPQHFDTLVKTIIPELIQSYGMGIRRKALIWSAGCSSGEEVYTLAMVLSEFKNKLPDFDFSVLGTDISTKVLKSAALGIYSHEKIEPVPLPLRRKYLLKSRDKDKNLVRIVPALRLNTFFKRLNFMDSNFGIKQPADIIFCRNVLIYFDRETQEKVLNRLCNYLVSGGYLFTGHSETLNGLNVPLVQTTSTVYKRLS
ncbi:Chemotaxis protein methyltransferase [Desulfonema limicola]|uniref:protein-glutamate O-methyltransferase n=1 Tax=Desulfonema limicola TaxID=45656 RepID=A0A975BA24_9BACT|nr:protein-glutamate O-methyltransferase [Desulfonema limicola]QTA81593.1 Chemotaxis protein methyltransferase [Desulfonema limicola]